MNEFEKCKYYIPSRLNRYQNYKNKYNKNTIDVIKEVNCNLDFEYYSLDKKALPSLNNLILVNKYYHLEPNYIPDDLVYINSKYSLRGCIKKYVNLAFIEMCEDALKEDVYLLNTSPYRSYRRQTEIYNELYEERGEKADLTSARPGYSEHQTGLAIDIRTKDVDIDDIYGTKEYYWLINNAYKYGFILRYPKGKEYLTGYAFEPWHYRYVGRDIAKYIYENDITFDEYYAYFIEK